jgi:hypothetical protein
VQETRIVASRLPFSAYVGLVGGIALFLLVSMLGCEEPLDVPPRMFKTVADAGSAESGLAVNGDPCTTDDECESAHCDNSICCADGNCCRRPADCPATDGIMAVCDDPAACQGKRGAVSCSKKTFQCEPRDDADDDSACTDKIVAISCDPFQPVHCTGERDQEAPVCPDECKSDSDCLDEAHCFERNCVPDAVAAQSCKKDGDCVSGHCSNGICCASGTCCKDVSDCQAPEFNTAATCDSPPSCQGFHGVPACENSQCTAKHVNDDSACDGTVVANDCGAATDVFCSGEREQGSNPRACPSGRCSQDVECPRTAHCQMGMCMPDLPNGESCSSPDMCQSGHCADDICCSYDCCAVENRCPAAPTTCPEDVKC